MDVTLTARVVVPFWLPPAAWLLIRLASGPTPEELARQRQLLDLQMQIERLRAQGQDDAARVGVAIGINFDSLINATITLDANGTLGPPSGGYPGKSGVFSIINASGTASLAAHSSYRMPKGGITIEGGVNAATRIPYMIGGAGVVILFPASKWSA